VLEHEASQDLNDMIWYRENLYISSVAYGLHVFDGTKVSPPKVITSFGSILGKKEEICPGSKAPLGAFSMPEDQANLFETLSTVEVSGDILGPASMCTLILMGNSSCGRG